MKTFFIAGSMAVLCAALAICLALAPVLISPRPANEPGNILLVVSVLATMVFGLTGLAVGGYIGWRLAR